MRLPFNAPRAGFVSAALVVALTACTGPYQGSKVTGVHYTGDENPRLHLGYLSTGPDVRAVVVGPGQANDGRLASAVVASMNAHQFGPEINYTTDPQHEAGEGYRVVMVLGGGPLRGARLCPDTDQGVTIQGGDRAGLQAAFCYRGRSLSEAYVEVPSLEGPGDPNLDRAVAIAMYRLFPLYVPTDGPCRTVTGC